MKYQILFLLSIIFISCQKQKKDFPKTIDRIQISKIVKLPAPAHIYETRYYIMQLKKQHNDTLLFMYIYPRKKIFVYSLSQKVLLKEIPIYNKLHNIYSFKYCTDDSIWILGSASQHYNFDSSLIVINHKGIVKHIYPFYHDYFITLKTYPNLYSVSDPFDENAFDTILFINTSVLPDNLITDHKVFFSTVPLGASQQHQQKRQLPICGYYDIVSRQVVLRKSVYYPDLSDSLYYPIYYVAGSQIFSHRKTFLLTYYYTPTILEWFWRKNRFLKHTNFFSQVALPPQFTKSSDDFRLTTAYYKIFYMPSEHTYFRFVALDDRQCNQKLVVFADTNFNYKGEALITDEYIPRYVFNENLISASIQDDSLVIRFFQYKYKKLNIDTLKHQIDSLCHIMKHNSCEVPDQQSSSHYDTLLLFNYLKNKFSIEDSSFALIILSEEGCHSCNDHIAKFISVNKNLFFTFQASPFYLIYQASGKCNKTVENQLAYYGLQKNEHVRTDTSSIYHTINPFSSFNPRLVLVKDKKIISDTVYMPDEINRMKIKLMKFYGLERK